jgi:hypothetical protein
MSYAMSAPAGDTRGFIDKPSWVGLEWDRRWLVSRRFTPSVLLGWANFNERVIGTVVLPSVTQTGRQDRQLVVCSFLAGGRWYPRVKSAQRWWVGAHAGAVFDYQMLDAGGTELWRSSWHFATSPEAGASVAVSETVAMSLSVRYTVPRSGGDYLGGGPRAFRYLTVKLGLGER